MNAPPPATSELKEPTSSDNLRITTEPGAAQSRAASTSCEAFSLPAGRFGREHIYPVVITPHRLKLRAGRRRGPAAGPGRYYSSAGESLRQVLFLERVRKKNDGRRGKLPGGVPLQCLQDLEGALRLMIVEKERAHLL